MSYSFTKLFSSITESTIWVAPDPHRITWICMLAMADRKGRVFASIPGLANRARVQVSDVEAAIISFLGPDTYSRTKDHEGKRIEEIDGGWRLINYQKYRAMCDEETIKESKRRYINERRARERSVDNSRKSRNQSKQAEAEAERSKTNTPSSAKPRRGSLPSDFTLTEATLQWCKKRQVPADELQARYDWFRDYARSTGKQYVDWQAAFKNSVRGNWAKINPGTYGTTKLAI